MRLSEIYTSVQGEGPGAGWLTQFVRFAGCNLKCPGWPCDTEHAINPAKFRHEWQTNTPMQVMERLDAYPKRVTLTGGEPFLQSAEQLDRLFRMLTEAGYHIEVFTNGTLEFPKWVMAPNVTVIMDWKLKGSGEGNERVDVRKQNLSLLTTGEVNDHAVKFVCADQHDFLEAVALYRNDLPVLFPYVAHMYVGAAWGKVTEAEVVEWLKKVDVPFKLNVQVHNYLWPRDQRGT